MGIIVQSAERELYIIERKVHAVYGITALQSECRERDSEWQYETAILLWVGSE